jgi:hypothetical protein
LAPPEDTTEGSALNDSRDKGLGDFGVGWRLGLNSLSAQANGPAGDGWVGTTRGGFFFFTYCISPTRSHVATVTFPDGTTMKFQAVITSPAGGCSPVIPPLFVNLGYQALPGTSASLVPLNGGTDLLVAGGFQNTPTQLLDFDGSGGPSDPTLFQLTLNDGRAFVIDRTTGLQSVTDANGNKLTITPNGITHSDGRNVTFSRDSSNRITQITDAARTGTLR